MRTARRRVKRLASRTGQSVRSSQENDDLVAARHTSHSVYATTPPPSPIEAPAPVAKDTAKLSAASLAAGSVRAPASEFPLNQVGSPANSNVELGQSSSKVCSGSQLRDRNARMIRTHIHDSMLQFRLANPASSFQDWASNVGAVWRSAPSPDPAIDTLLAHQQLWADVGAGLPVVAAVTARRFSSQRSPPPHAELTPPPPPPTSERLLPITSKGHGGPVATWAARSPALCARIARGLPLNAPPPPPPRESIEQAQRAAAMPDPWHQLVLNRGALHNSLDDDSHDDDVTDDSLSEEGAMSAVGSSLKRDDTSFATELYVAKQSQREMAKTMAEVLQDRRHRRHRRLGIDHS